MLVFFNQLILLQITDTWASKTAQQVKVFATNTDDLNSIPGIFNQNPQGGKREKLHKLNLWPPHIHKHTRSLSFTHILNT